MFYFLEFLEKGWKIVFVNGELSGECDIFC